MLTSSTWVEIKDPNSHRWALVLLSGQNKAELKRLALLELMKMCWWRHIEHIWRGSRSLIHLLYIKLILYHCISCLVSFIVKIFPFTSDLFVSRVQVYHKSVVSVVESSDDITAGGGTNAFSTLPPRLTINRPFIFIIYHQATGSVLFMGRVIDPTKK